MFSAGSAPPAPSRRRCPDRSRCRSPSQCCRPVAAAVAVDLGLRHRVRRRVGPGLADLEQAVVVARPRRAAHESQPGMPGIRIGHHHPGQRRVAGVGYRDRVVDASRRSTSADVPAPASLTMFSAVALRHRHRRVVGVRGRPGAGRRRHVDQGRPRCRSRPASPCAPPCRSRSRRHPASRRCRCRRR